MKRRWLKRAAWIALALVVVLSVVLVTLLNSRAGAQWTIDRLVAMSGVDISHAPVSGNLLRGLSLDSLRYRDDARLVEAEDIDLAIDWSQLMTGKLVLSDVRVRHARHQETGPPGPGEMLDLELPQWPFVLCVARLHLDTLVSGAAESATSLNSVSVTDACINGDDHQLVVADASLETLGVEVGIVNLEADVKGQVPLSASLSWNYPEQGWSGSGPVSGTLDLLELEQGIDGPYPFDAAGTLAPFEGQEPVLDFRATWREWQAGDLALRSGNAHLAGVLENYTLAFSFTAVLPDNLESKVDGSGTGDLDGLRAIDAELKSSIGKARYRGQLEWKADISSTGLLTVTGFDPRWLHESLSGSLDGSADFTLLGQDKARFGNLEVGGRLNGQPLGLTGTAETAAGSVVCLSCRLVAGENEVNFDGSLENEQVDADLEIRAPSLHTFLPGLSGRLNADGRLSGALSSPIFTGRAGGTGLAYGGWTLARFNISSGSVSADEIRFSLLAQDLSYEDSPPARVAANASGKLSALDVDFEWVSSWLNASVRAGLGLGEDSLDGTIRSAQFSEQFSGSWKLENPLDFKATSAGFMAGSHRWLHEDSEPASEIEIVVSTFSMDDEVTAIVASLGHWPLRTLDALLPNQQQLEGSADAALDVNYRDGAWSGSVEWRQTGTVLIAQVPGADKAEIRIPQAWLNADLVDGGAKVSARMEIEPDVSAELQLWADSVAPSAEISGNIMLTGSDWTWVSSVVPDIDRLEGEVSADLALSGPLLSPAIKGSMDWKRGRLMIPVSNVLLEDINFSLQGEPNGAASFSGSARAGEGMLGLEGRFENIMTSERRAQLKITGDTAHLLDWPEYQVWLSPNVDISSDEEGWELRGTLTLPRAEVSLRELPEGAVTISEDVRVIGTEEPATRPTRYFGEAQLVLGEQVHVQLFGLDTRLQGSLRLRQARGRPPTANGEVALVGGTFEAYGQKLEIEEGTLRFTGPFDNPVVDVKAVRVIETFDGTVKAGIHLQGRALSLSSKVFSTPAMAEADALSYLVIGRPLSQVSEAEGADVSNAAIALGLGQASRITQQIGDRLGLDQLSLVGDGGEGTALVAGKQVNKRLYARYAYGVFSRLGTLLLRYKLSRRVAIEAASGERQSLDILYTVEKQ